VRLSARGEYALRALLDLALFDGEGLVPIQDVAARQRIPQRYLEQVLLQLKRAGLADSRRGAAGGYRLSRAGRDITVGAVLRAVEGGTATSGARGQRQADDTGDLAGLLREVDEAVAAVVDRVTIDDLKRRAEERRSAARPMYHI
jgi:Rrf2 family protein